MIEAILNFFGVGNRADEPEIEIVTKPVAQADRRTIRQPAAKPVVQRQPQISLKKAQARKATINPRSYYRRNGSYYSVADDCLIEDLMLLYILSELFTANDVPTFEEMEQEAFEASHADAVEEPVEDLLDVDVSETPVVEAPEPQVDIWKPEPEPAYVAPEPSYAPEPEPVKQDSYSSGSSYGSGSSDYDSGSSDSGSSDD